VEDFGSVPSATSWLSTTRISPAQSATLSSARPIRWASAPEIMQTERGSRFCSVFIRARLGLDPTFSGGGACA
jgi:hypothetical protein